MKYPFLYRNSLSLVFLVLMILSLTGQVYTGWREHNDFLSDYGRHETLGGYLSSGHFLQATFENWESEFLQMALFVVFTIFLRQRGSSESKLCSEESFDKKDLVPKEDSPRPVKKGGLYLAVYKHSLSISLFVLFLLSFVLHWYGSWIDYNEEQELKGKPGKLFLEFLSSSKMWFESFQNWQSEFLSIFAIIFPLYLSEAIRLLTIQTCKCRTCQNRRGLIAIHTNGRVALILNLFSG